MPQVEVTFDVDANGILNVKALDKATNKEQSIRIEARSGLSKEDIEKMQKDAESNASADAEKKELVEAKNIAEQLVYTSEKSLKDAGDKVPEDVKKSIEEKIANLKKEREGGTKDSIKSATETLSTELSKIGEYMNKQQTPNQDSTSSSGTGQATDSDVKDAEVKDEPDTDNTNNPTNGTN
jgi:molecular chaperone DnaK